MPIAPRPDEFEGRRARLRGLSDEDLRAHFWSLVERIVTPLVEEARTHTTPAIERSVLLRMGFSSVEAKELVARLAERGLLGHGAGRVVLELAERRSGSVREVGLGLLEGRYWDEVGR